MLKNFLVLIIGAAIGFGAHAAFVKSAQPIGMHRMPDGTLMRNDGNPIAHQNMSMEQMMDQMNETLVGKKDSEFDAAFLEQMIVHHEGAVEMAELVLTSTTRAELVVLAKAIISAQTTEIEQMRAWQRAWFGVEPI